jgi:hypothetical protein
MRQALLCACVALFSFLSLNAQINIPPSGTVTETFNAMNTGTALPSGWKMSAAGTTADWTSVSNVTTVSQQASSGTPTTAGRYNWGTTAATDRAIGFMTDGSYSTPNTILAQFRNTTGTTITALTLTFQVERYRVNTAGFFLQFASSATGTGWTPQASGNISAAVFATAASAYTFETPRTVYKTVTLTGISIANNADYYFRWVFNNVNSANSQGLGLDNVKLEVSSTGSPAVTATLQDALINDNGNDVNGDGKVNEGDKITYTTTINNNGNTANGVTYNGTLDANTTLSGTVKSTPLATNDAFTILLNTQLTGQNVLTNDFGLPTKTVVSFGSSEFDVTKVAGATGGKSDNGGDVVVNSDGSFTYTPPAGFTGYDRFSYAIEAGVTPNDVGTVTIAVGSAPSAGPAESFPGVIGNVSVSNAPSLTSNDGGDDIAITDVSGSAVSGFPYITTTTHGNLTLNEDGTFTYNPAAGYTGTDNFTYTIDNGFSSPVTVTVPITVSGMIWFINNTAAAGGDGRLSSPFNSLAGVSNGAGGSGDGQTIFVYSGSGNYSGGIVLKNGQKLIGQAASATLASIAGVTVPAYSAALPATLGTAPVLTSAAAVITLANGNTVRGLSTTGGTTSVLGTTVAGAVIQQNTFTGASAEGISLTGHSGASSIFGNTVSATSNAIRVTLATAGGLNLLLTGNAITSTASTGISIDGTGGTLTLTGFAGNRVSGNTAIHGIHIINARFDAIPGGGYEVVSGGGTTIGESGNPVGGAGLHLSNVTGNLSFSDLDIYAAGSGSSGLFASSSGTYSAAGTGFQIAVAAGVSTIEANGGPGVTITESTINLPLASYTSTNSTSRGLLLGNTTGTFSTSTTGGITGSAVSGVYITAGNSNITIGVPVTVTQGEGVHIGNRTGGTVAFTGALSLSTGANTGFHALGSGTITVTGTTNTITTTTGTALNVVNTTIGAGGLNFKSISANGAANGIVLNNTGATAGLTVTGDGATANSGGTIQNTTGDGVSLISTSNVSFNGIRVAETGGDGISGSAVHGFNLTNSTIFGAGDGDEENGIIFGQDNVNVGPVTTLGVDGTVLIQDVVIDGNNNSTQWGLRVYNNANAATLNMTLRRLTVQNNVWTFGEDATSIRIFDGTANVLVDDCDFLDTDGSGITGDAGDSSPGEGALINVTVQNSTFQRNHALPSGVNFRTSGDGTGRFKVVNNVMTQTGETSGPNIPSLGMDFDASINSNLHAIVMNNTLNNIGFGGGLELIANENSIARADIRDNTVNLTGSAQTGMNFHVRNVPESSGQTGSLDLTLFHNIINGMNPGAAVVSGFQLLAGSSSSTGGTHPNRITVNVSTAHGAGDNEVNGTNGTFNFDFVIRQRLSATFQFQGYAGAAGDANAVASFVHANNPDGNLGIDTNADVFVGSGSNHITNYTSGVAALPTTPTLPPL